MGFTYIELEVANLENPSETKKVEFLVDSGAINSVVPYPILDALGIKPYTRQTFFLADGTRIEREKGAALFTFEERVGVSDVLFGEPDDANLLGVLTLESLGLALDPLKRELRQLPMILGTILRESDR